jgi:hypothetical protein
LRHSPAWNNRVLLALEQANQRLAVYNGSELTMTVLGAVVFGGLLALGVLWLLVTAPSSDVDQAWDQAQKSLGTPESVPGTLVLSHASHNRPA